MSNDEAEAIEAYYENTDAAQHRQIFLKRMEKKYRSRYLASRSR